MMNKVLKCITFAHTMRYGHQKPTSHHHATAFSCRPAEAVIGLTGNSQSSLIAELLEGSGPVFDRMIKVMEAAKTAKEAMRGKIAGDIEAAQAKIEGALGIALEGFDSFTGALLDEAEEVKRRARRKGAAGVARAPAGELGAAAPTPISNRGVRLDPIATKSIAPNTVQDLPKAEKSW